jgi:uncharacterized protein (DUF1330 family)
MVAIFFVGQTLLANAAQNNTVIASNTQSQPKETYVAESASQSKPVYLVAQFTVTDVENFGEQYGKPVTQQLENIGAKFLAISKNPEVLEGKWNHKSTVIIEFPSMDVLRKWYASKEYKKIKDIRIKNLTSGGNLILLPGL